MKTILIVLMAVLLSGCTIYRVQTERDTAGNITVTANIYSSRSFTAPELAYIREGADASFTFGADGTTQPGPQDYAAGVATGIRAMMVPPQ
jgi:hypothetical protein